MPSKYKYGVQLIADLLFKVVKKGAAAKWSFSNLAAMVRLHLMTYIDLAGFLKSPEKALIKMLLKAKPYHYHQLRLITCPAKEFIAIKHIYSSSYQ